MKAMATEINMNVMFRSMLRCRCCLLRVDAVAREVSRPLELLVLVDERLIDVF